MDTNQQFGDLAAKIAFRHEAGRVQSIQVLDDLASEGYDFNLPEDNEENHDARARASRKFREHSQADFTKALSLLESGKIRMAAPVEKVAGEVRFVKDRSGDKGEWGWNTTGPSERQIGGDFVFNAKYLKPLAKVLRSCLMALGHATSAHTRLVKVKSRNVSPDGALGGKGYIQKIPDMRRQLMNCVEVLSSITDTIHDELNADHWDPAEDKLNARDREEVREIVEEAEEIRDDPEAWAGEEESATEKTANPFRVAGRYKRSLPSDRS